MVFFKVNEFRHGGDKTKGSQDPLVREVAKEAGVGETTIKRANAVKKTGTAGLVAPVETNLVTMLTILLTGNTAAAAVK
jgi:hypothetical protein